MNTQSPIRVRFQPGQLLTSEDFIAEQDFHLAGQRRHTLAAQGWGVASGLMVRVQSQGFQVTPGMAIDGFGRELVVNLPIDVSAILDAAQKRWTLESQFVVSLNFGRAPAEQSTRWREVPWISIEPASQPFAYPPFAPWQRAPDDERQRWPVPLGQFLTIENGAADGDPDAIKSVFRYAIHGRKEAELITSEIRDPAGRSRLALGDDLAVVLSDRDGKDRTILAIDTTGNARIDGDTAVEGMVSVGGDLTFTEAKHAAEMIEPWSFYRVAGETRQADVDSDQDATAGGGDQNELTARRPDEDELRLVLPEGAGRLVIGARSDKDGKFVPTLTVDPDGTVIVHGDLVVEGITKKEPGASLKASNLDQAVIVKEQEDSEMANTTQAAVPGSGPSLLQRLSARPGMTAIGAVALGTLFGDALRPLESAFGCNAVQAVFSSYECTDGHTPITMPPAPEELATLNESLGKLRTSIDAVSDAVDKLSAAPR